ncbi:MAG: hypothetical protein ABR541_01850 [Candidatus Dormibacteria bacterium]
MPTPCQRVSFADAAGAPAITIILTLAGLVLSACGGTPPGTGHDSPSAAARGFVASAHGDAAAAVPWLAPSDRRAFSDLIAFNQRSNLELTLRAEGVTLGRVDWESADRADLAYSGRIVACTAGELPSPDSDAVNECRPILEDATGRRVLHLAREDGAWYVFFDIGSGGELSGAVTPPAPTPR